jgi:hypothetical protein
MNGLAGSMIRQIRAASLGLRPPFHQLHIHSAPGDRKTVADCSRLSCSEGVNDSSPYRPALLFIASFVGFDAVASGRSNC